MNPFRIDFSSNQSVQIIWSTISVVTTNCFLQHFVIGVTIHIKVIQTYWLIQNYIQKPKTFALFQTPEIDWSERSYLTTTSWNFLKWKKNLIIIMDMAFVSTIKYDPNKNSHNSFLNFSWRTQCLCMDWNCENWPRYSWKWIRKKFQSRAIY